MDDDKLSGRVIIDTVLENMRQQVEELRYSKIVPSAYDVYLHADDHLRFESLGHEIAAEAVRALQERLDALNRVSRLDRVRELVGKPRLPYKKVGPWLVRIACDPDGTVPRGRALVVSQIALAGSEAFEGQRTRRLATLSEPVSSPEPARPAPESPRAVESRPSAAESGPSAPAAMPAAPDAVATATASGGATTSAAATSAVPDPSHAADTRPIPNLPAHAVLAWEDDAGPHRVPMTGLELTVGRAAQGSTADVRLATLPDVSRVHVRVRFHPEGARFSIEDLSLLGTTVNGEALERGTPRDLPTPADIRLADAITLRFESGALS